MYHHIGTTELTMMIIILDITVIPYMILRMFLFQLVLRYRTLLSTRVLR